MPLHADFQAWVVENDEHDSSKTWAIFVASEISRPVPGSLNFIKYANSKGVAVFHVSNRKGREEAPIRRT